MGVFKQKESAASAELIARRAQWEPSSNGMRILGEYWLQTNDPALPGIITSFETDNVAEIMETFAAFDEAFDITVVPAISADEGLQMIQQMMPQQQGG